MSENNIIEELYMHLCNSGFTIAIADNGSGPEIQMTTSTFGNLKSSMKVFVTPQDLQKIGLMFLNASQKEFSKIYCHAAASEDKFRSELTKE